MRQRMQMDLREMMRSAHTLDLEQALATACLLEAFIIAEFKASHAPCPLESPTRPQLCALGRLELIEWCKALAALVGSKHGQIVEFILES